MQTAPNSAANAANAANRSRENEAIDSRQISNFLRNYIKVASANDVNAAAALYADRVDYYDNGIVDQNAIRRDLEKDIQTWPDRRFGIPEPPKIRPGTDADTFIAEFPLKYSARNDRGTNAGLLQTTMQIRVIDGEPKITSIKSTVISTSKEPGQ